MFCIFALGNSSKFFLNTTIMKKLFKFLEGLTSSIIDTFGQPNIQFYSNSYDVCFVTSNTIQKLDLDNLGCLISISDEFRFFGTSDGKVTFCFSIYSDVD